MVLELLFSLLLAVHLLCVNVAAGGPLVAAWLDWRGVRGDVAAAVAARYLAGWSLATFLAGALLGLLVGWAKWDADYRDLWLGPLSYKLHMAGIEAIFSLLLLLGWWWWLPKSAGKARWAAGVRGVLALLAATNLLYHFPLLFSVAAHLDDAGLTRGERIDGSAFRQLMSRGESPALAVHVVLASVAVAGTMLLGLALRRQRAGDTSAATKIAVWGGRWALAATLLQLPVGLWTLTKLSSAMQTRLMGGDALGTLLFLASLVAAFWLVRELVAVAMGEISRAALTRSMAAMVLTVILMTAMQQSARGRTAPAPTASETILPNALLSELLP